jgi:biotin carboxyl carrier protein
MVKIRREDASMLRLEVEGGEDAPAAVPRAGVPALVRRRVALGRVRSGAIAALWGTIGGAVIGYGVVLVYANVARVEVDSAVVAGTLQPIRAPSAGIVTDQLVQPGARFAARQPLFTVHDPELEQSIALATQRVERARHDLVQREAELGAERARRENYIIRARGEVARLEEEVRGMERLERSLTVRRDAVAVLFGQGLATRLRLEELEGRLADVSATTAQARIRLDEKRGLYDALLSGHGYGAGEVVVRLSDAAAAVERAKAELEVTTTELRTRMARRASLIVAAPTAGRLVRNVRLDGSHVLAGDTVALVEREDDRTVEAFMTQAEAGRIGLGDSADVMLPAQRLAAQARVVAVERSGAYLDDVETRYRWNLTRDMGIRLNDRDRSARVTLRFEGDDLKAARRVLDLGTPAVVSFKRRWNGGPLFQTFQPLAAQVEVPPPSTPPAQATPAAAAGAAGGAPSPTRPGPQPVLQARR